MSVVAEGLTWRIDLQIMVKTTIPSVFSSIADPNKIVVWDYPDKVDLEPIPGGIYKMWFDGVIYSGVVMEYKPPTILAYRIATPLPSLSKNVTFNAIIKFNIDEVFGMTRVRLIHSGFPRIEIANYEEKVWDKVYLPKLKQFCENGFVEDLNGKHIAMK